jgi:membrane protease YdiL (CAAX protease family)
MTDPLVLRYPWAVNEPPNPRWLLPIELLAIAACVILPWLVDLPVPAALPLLAIASVSMSVRRMTFFSAPRTGSGEAMWIGAGAGLVALIISVLVATPVLQHGVGLVVQWSVFPAVRGSGAQLFSVAVLVVALAVAQELIFRRWLIERAYQLGASGSGSIMIAGGAEAMIGPGPLGVRLGLALFGVALGMLYWRAGRRLGPALAARLAFALGALVLQALQWIG